MRGRGPGPEPQDEGPQRRAGRVVPDTTQRSNHTPPGLALCRPPWGLARADDCGVEVRLGRRSGSQVHGNCRGPLPENQRGGEESCGDSSLYGFCFYFSSMEESPSDLGHKCPVSLRMFLLRVKFLARPLRLILCHLSIQGFLLNSTSVHLPKLLFSFFPQIFSLRSLHFIAKAIFQSEKRLFPPIPTTRVLEDGLQKIPLGAQQKALLCPLLSKV